MNKLPHGQVAITMNEVHKAYIECRRLAYVWYNATAQSSEYQLALDKMLDALQDMVRSLEECAYGEAMTTFEEEEINETQTHKV